MRAFGVARDAKDGADPRDLVAPPSPFGAGVQVAFVGAGGAGAQRMVDLKSNDGLEKTWYLRVTAASAQRELSLAWPDLSAIPEQYSPILEDTATGARCYMRTTAAYRIRMAEGGSRLFKIIVQPRGVGAALLSGARAQAAPGGRVAFSFALGAAANVDVVVRNLAGVVIRRVTTGQVAAAGVNTIAWNGRADSGSRVPAGRYLCEITARAPEGGQTVSAVAAFEVRR